MFVTLKPLGERKVTADQIVARLRGQLGSVPGGSLFLQAVQDLRIGGFASNAQYQYTLSARRPEGSRGLGAEGASEAPVRSRDSWTSTPTSR